MGGEYGGDRGGYGTYVSGEGMKEVSVPLVCELVVQLLLKEYRLCLERERKGREGGREGDIRRQKERKGEGRGSHEEYTQQ